MLFVSSRRRHTRCAVVTGGHVCSADLFGRMFALALDPKTPENIRPKSIIYEPRTASNISAKRCVTILDTSGSMFGDPKLISDCIKEISTICKRVNTSQIIIFADADVCEVVDIEDSDRKISELKPKGGGGTDFRPAIALAE